MWHTATAISLGPGRTQVTMFGGCPKWEDGKSLDAQQKLAQTTVLGFGEQNAHMHDISAFICLLSVAFSCLVLLVICLIRTIKLLTTFSTNLMQ